ncbi:hypothetical protein PQJ75_13945 [Rhodoplanes sp. TEM]|uniref:Uncharacterized protein n=1 Tax=Rhodoplanes tepidamans TaxID=200616 RepID=A0ABT5JEF6_RHOTP|nr:MULTISPECIES: hypothetical protein [Rhodoplanes]MDC7787994.1 hypothetical protein [Rhodoplanes tepidamans]MDC7984834.1 hypothetical protein [Rhodoplanes sp. TEM]MDQ0358423.1 hypothetical protein [Rhodoplanes tepidamans]
MAFEQLIIASPADAWDARVSLVCLGTAARRSPKPSMTVMLSRALMARAKVYHEDRFDVLLGTGDDAGMMRLVRAKNGAAKGVVVGGGKAMKINCGHVARFGESAQPRQDCAVDLLADGAIEITLPRWALASETE